MESNYVHSVALDYFRYARRYHEYMFEKPLSDLMTLSRDKRLHAIKALTSLSKFLGVYRQFAERRKDYGIKWEMPNGLAVFNRMLKKTSEDGLEWLKQAMKALLHIRTICSLQRSAG